MNNNNNEENRRNEYVTSYYLFRKLERTSIQTFDNDMVINC